jgi:hypothetical protein
VGFSEDNAPTMVDVSLPFHEAIDYIYMYAFQVDTGTQTRIQAEEYGEMVRKTMDPSAKNQKKIQDTYTSYPLVLNIRVYRPPTSKIDIVDLVYSEIQKSVNQNPKNRVKQHISEATGSAIKLSQYTPMADLMGKVLVSMDIENILQIYTSPAPYDPEKIPVSTRETIEKMVNIKTGGENWGTFYRYADVLKNPPTPLTKLSDNVNNVSYETNTLSMKLCYPGYDEKTENPDALHFLLKYQIQCVPMRYYILGSNLDNYNRMFDSNKTPFLPLYNAHTYLTDTRMYKPPK